MNNFSDSNLPPTSSSSPEDNTNAKGRIRTKHKKVALLLALGYPVPVVAKETGLSQSRIYHLLSDKNSFVNMEMNRIMEETLKTRNLLLLNLFLEVLHRLDAMLESGNDQERDEAIDQVINLVLAGRGRNGQPFISQYFNIQSQGNQGVPETIDEMILRKGRERDLKDKKSE